MHHWKKFFNLKICIFNQTAGQIKPFVVGATVHRRVSHDMTTRHRAGRHRSPLICGAGPDSERCGRQHGKALATLCLVLPRRDSTLLLLFGLASPNKLTAGFMARHHNAMLFIQSVISAHKSCQNPDREFPHWALQA